MSNALKHCTGCGHDKPIAAFQVEETNNRGQKYTRTRKWCDQCCAALSERQAKSAGRAGRAMRWEAERRQKEAEQHQESMRTDSKYCSAQCRQKIKDVARHADSMYRTAADARKMVEAGFENGALSERQTKELRKKLAIAQAPTTC